jgi:hypothetical protein
MSATVIQLPRRATPAKPPIRPKVKSTRPRYAAIVKQLTELMLGPPLPADDPARTVFNRRIARLSISQRAMIGARMEGAKQGRLRADRIRQCDIAAWLHISEDTMRSATVVLHRGTQAEIRQAESSETGVATLAKRITKGLTILERRRESKVPYSHKDKRAAYLQRIHLHGGVWKQLRTGLEALTSLPDASDVAEVARLYDRGLINEKSLKAMEWLGEFLDAWTKPR